MNPGSSDPEDIGNQSTTGARAFAISSNATIFVHGMYVAVG